MSNVEIVLNSDGIQELLQSQELLDICDKYGQDIAKRAEGNYTVDSQVHNRVVTRVTTADQKTFYRNLHANYLLKALR